MGFFINTPTVETLGNGRKLLIMNQTITQGFNRGRKQDNAL